MKAFTFTILCSCLSTLAGCTGAHSHITADTAKYPISLSPTVRDSDGTLLGGPDLTPVGKYHHSYTAVAMAYSYGTFNKKQDLSESVNKQVADANGEAVINLRVEHQNHCIVLNNILFLNLLPIWPGCSHVKVIGNIVKRSDRYKNRTPPAPEKPAAPKDQAPAEPEAKEPKPADDEAKPEPDGPAEPAPAEEAPKPKGQAQDEDSEDPG